MMNRREWPGDRLPDGSTQKDKEITQLKADLAKFGGHTAECTQRRTLSRIGVGGMDVIPECDCGYEQAKERWK